jgi:hypothetical protein
MISFEIDPLDPVLSSQDDVVPAQCREKRHDIDALGHGEWIDGTTGAGKITPSVTVESGDARLGRAAAWRGR